MRTRLAAVLVLACGIGTASAQVKDEPKGLSRAELDKRAALAAYDAAVIGTDLFNNAKDQEACFRLYQGTLIGLLPMLEHHPSLAASIRDRLDAVKRLKPGEAAFVLRESLEHVQDLNRAKRTLLQRVGGELRIQVIVKDFLRAIANDPNVNVTRNGKYKLDDKAVAQLAQLLAEQLAEAAGGPKKYTGRDMKKTHEGMKITEAEFNAARTHFVAVLVSQKPPVPEAEREELLAIFDSTKNDIVEVKDEKPKAGEKEGAKKSLWDRLGGEDKVRVIVREFLGNAAPDPKVNFTRSGKYKFEGDALKKLEDMLVAQISAATGGPLKYEGRDMKKVHEGMKITKAEFEALAKHFTAALNKYRVPLREVAEMTDIIRSTMKDIVEEK